MKFEISDENKNRSGTYKIVNSVDCRMYIGSTVNFEYRYKLHLSDLQKGEHHCRYLQRFVNKHGIDVLQFELVEIVVNKNDLLMREQFYLDTYFGQGLLFNAAKTAGAPNLGVSLSEETKKRIGQANLGKRRTEEQKELLRKINTGRCHSEESREKIRVANLGNTTWLGRKHSEETKKKMKGRRNRLGMYNSEETKEKQRIGSTGRKQTDEAKRKISLALKGNNHTLGKKFSEEVKRKWSIIRKQYWEEKKRGGINGQNCYCRRR